MNGPNRQILLDTRPKGRLTRRHFSVASGDIPEPGPDEVLCRTILLSVDPANRAWMEGVSYRAQIAEGQVMAGYGVCEVLTDGNERVAAGALVLGEPGWQEYAALPVRSLRRIERRSALTHHLSVLGPTGLTAYFGLLEVGRPQSGETVVVSAAAGATGSVAGQIAKIKGARVVGIAGSDEKVQLLRQRLGFDAAVSHRSPTLEEDLRAACPDGVDVYFDNVGGQVLETILPLMNVHGRVVCCGAVSQYEKGPVAQTTVTKGVPGLLIMQRLRMEGILLLDFVKRFRVAESELAGWLQDGRLVALEDVCDGLETAPDALIGLLRGDNVGKRMVRVGPDPEPG
jgi:NADPH-dependent curcumin reductase CurA